MNRFLIIASFCLAAVAVAPLVAEESRLSGRWNLDAQETLRQNYPAMKAANPRTPELDVLLASSAGVNVVDSLIIVENRVEVVVADLKTPYQIVESWRDIGSQAHYIKSKAENAVTDNVQRYFIFVVANDVLTWHELRKGSLLTKIYRRDIGGQGPPQDIVQFIDKTLRELQGIYQAGAYEDADGNGIGSYCFDSDLLFGVVRGLANEKFLKDLNPDNRRKALFEYRQLVNAGWTVKILPVGTDANAKEKSYRVIISKGRNAFIGIPGKAVEVRGDYDGK